MAASGLLDPCVIICSVHHNSHSRPIFVQFNFVGKILGPKGNSLKRLQEDTMCKMAVFGRGSMKDRRKVSAARELDGALDA